MISKLSSKKRDSVSISILLAAALFIGVYLIFNTVVISKDGVTFIEYAKEFGTVPVETMVNKAQHPGYPWLIFITHKITKFWHGNIPVFSWIYCAQCVALFFRIITIVLLYFTGKKVLDAKLSFWAVLILIILPKTAQYGSDVLSDWPHLCFLAAGLLLILNAFSNQKFWLFGFVGLASGVGYLIRPECVQLVLLSGLWLVLQFIWPRRIINRPRILLAMLLLIVGFSMLSGPYMKLKGSIFPKKSFDAFTQDARQMETYKNSEHMIQASLCSESNIIEAFEHLIDNIGEMLMWFFAPALFIGIYLWFKRRNWHEPQVFFMTAFIILNTVLLIMLYCKYKYMSYRHIMPLLMILIFYIPVGMQQFAGWFQYGLSKYARPFPLLYTGGKRWFFALFLIGFSICAPKLFKPIRMDKQGYIAVAKWLADNTNKEDLIAVPDIRIAFYAQRQGTVCNNKDIPSDAAYIVTIPMVSQDGIKRDDALYEYIGDEKKSIKLVVYRN
ncbi:MAG: glycosyltransferase family 39 protein [Sedimentisphaerales bacterium]|nr:glycosyltransferase family 39 protein [Sedimentisphaerales bacterium]